MGSPSSVPYLTEENASFLVDSIDNGFAWNSRRFGFQCKWKSSMRNTKDEVSKAWDNWHSNRLAFPMICSSDSVIKTTRSFSPFITELCHGTMWWNCAPRSLGRPRSSKFQINNQKDIKFSIMILVWNNVALPYHQVTTTHSKAVFWKDDWEKTGLHIPLLKRAFEVSKKNQFIKSLHFNIKILIDFFQH